MNETSIDDIERLGRESGDWRAAFYTLFNWLKDKSGSEMKLTLFANSEGPDANGTGAGS